MEVEQKWGKTKRNGNQTWEGEQTGKTKGNACEEVGRGEGGRRNMKKQNERKTDWKGGGKWRRKVARNRDKHGRENEKRTVQKRTANKKHPFHLQATQHSRRGREVGEDRTRSRTGKEGHRRHRAHQKRAQRTSKKTVMRRNEEAGKKGKGAGKSK